MPKSVASPMPIPREIVVVVEDDPLVCRGLCDMLDGRGWDVADYASAEEFLAAFSPERTSCLLLDARLPGISGLEALRTHGDADARGGDPPIGPDLVGGSEPLAKAVGDDKGCLARADIVEEDHELVTTHTRGGVARPKRGPESKGPRLLRCIYCRRWPLPRNLPD